MIQLLHKHVGLYTDFYELTMGQGYFFAGMAEKSATFDFFFRANPFAGGFTLFAGLQEMLKLLQQVRFDREDLDFLAGLGFKPEFLKYLEELRFRGTVYSMREGETIFPDEPVVRVEANIVEAQLVETLLLNTLNFQSLVATRAARLTAMAEGRVVVDFGLRRAQGLAGLHAARAAVIGGVNKTSNVLAGWLYGIATSGTQAHSWIQSFGDELASFRAYAETFPDSCTLLIDTYDTLHSGLPNAITVARELDRKGHRLMGVRLDSGDLAYLSRRVRAELDAAGFPDTKIIASNKLDEFVLRSLVQQQAPVDIFGVGTNLVTGRPDAALDGVYKLSTFDGSPRLKISETREKITLPGRKKVLRYFNVSDESQVDAVVLEQEEASPPDRMFHRVFPEKSLALDPRSAQPLMEKVMENGRNLIEARTLAEAAAHARERLDRLPPEYKRLENPHIYKVGISRRLMDTRDRLVAEHHGEQK